MTQEIDLKKRGTFHRIGKRNLFILAAVLLIGVAVYLNYLWFYDPVQNIGYGNNNMQGSGDSTNVSGTPDTTSSNYFTAAKLSRENARDEAMEVLQTVVDSQDALSETKDKALADISRIALDIEQEANIESLVKAKGFNNCIAVLNGTAISVIVESDGLLPSQVAQIKEIVYEQTGIKPTNIKIIEKSLAA